jgi:hypothetical protein
MLPKSVGDLSNSDGDELVFYDCDLDYDEEKATTPTAVLGPSKLSKRITSDQFSPHRKGSTRNMSTTSLYDDHKATDDHSFPLSDSRNYSRSNLSPSSLKRIYSQIHEREKHRTYSINGEEITTTRDLAVSLVETVFVLAEFWFWQVNVCVLFFSLSFFSAPFASGLSILCI